MYNYEVLKYVMLSKHYASDIDILDSDYQVAEKHIYYFYNSLINMYKFIELNNGDDKKEKIEDEILATIKEKFIEAMDDDFNSAAALANLHTIFKYANNLMKSAKKANKAQIANTLKYIIEQVKEVYGVLGFLKQEPEEFIKELKEKHLKKLNIQVDEIEKEISKRAEAKKNKEFSIADEIRAKLDEKGIILNDTVDGTIWDIKALY